LGEAVKVCIVSGADANYFPLVLELIESIRSFEKSANVDICIFDCGISDDQKEVLSGKVQRVVSPGWPEGINVKNSDNLEYLKSCVCRPFIPDIFPGYDVYLWMDSDTWVQDWFAVEMFIKAAKKPAKLAITNGADRCYQTRMRVKWLGYFPYKIASFYNTNAKLAFGRKVAKKMITQYVLSAACFAMRADAPHWKRWQELVVQATDRGKVFTAEQVSLGRMVYVEGYGVELLPAYAMWQCSIKPIWDEQREAFVETFVPHEKIGILHLSGIDKYRASSSEKDVFETVDRNEIERSYRYPQLDGGDLIVTSPDRK
jgi:hypothetical protein